MKNNWLEDRIAVTWIFPVVQKVRCLRVVVCYHFTEMIRKVISNRIVTGIFIILGTFKK